MATKSTAVKLTLKISSFILRLLLNIIFYIAVVVLIVIVSKEAFTFTYQLYGPATVDVAPGNEIIFQIKKGESSMDVASKLEHNHVIVNKYSFYLKTKLEEFVIMPGTYIINSSMTYNEILAIITDYSASIVKEEEAEGDTEEDAGNASEVEDGSESDSASETEETN